MIGKAGSFLHRYTVFKNADACIGCGQCELRCPDYAIFVDKEEA